MVFVFFFQAEDGIRDIGVTGVQTCALPISDVMGHDPCNGNVYIFMNRARNRIKLLHWEAGGMVLYSKLLETGTFGKPGSFSKDDICEAIEWRDQIGRAHV